MPFALGGGVDLFPGLDGLMLHCGLRPNLRRMGAPVGDIAAERLCEFPSRRQISELARTARRRRRPCGG